MSEDIGEATADLLKEMVEEIRTLRKRVEQLESNNNVLVKAVDNPETMMKKAGWLKVVTPMADETFDPLNREIGDGNQSFAGPFQGSGDTFQKQDRHTELEAWKEAERVVSGQ